jgi:hypothetical protein
MAAEGQSQNDMQAHVASFSKFTVMMKWGAIISVITALIVVLIIRS